MISTKYLEFSFLAKRDCGAGGIRTSTIGGKMLPCKRSLCKKRGRAYQVRSLERLIDGILLAPFQRF